MKRWFIARMGDWDSQGVISPKVSAYEGVRHRSWTANAMPWCFGQLAVADLTPLQADPDIYILPDGALDMSIGSIPASVRTTLRSRLESAGFVFTDVKTNWTVRQMLVYLLRQIQPRLDSVEQGDVQDVEN